MFASLNFLNWGKMKLLALVVSSVLFAGLVPAAVAKPAVQALATTPTVLNATAGLCPNWNLSGFSPRATGYSWGRSGNRNIVLEWSLSPTNLEGLPVTRKFSADEEAQVRAAMTWWDSVFDTIAFREVSGDYAEIKIGITSSTSRTNGRYWYFYSGDLQKGYIALPPLSYESSVTSGRATLDHQVRNAMPFLLGLSNFAAPTPEVQSALRQIYGENNCYPVPLSASWSGPGGSISQNKLVAIGSVARINTSYAGRSQIASTSLTPEVCSVPNFSTAPGSGVLVNITGQGVCSVLLQARESALPSATEVMTIRTGLGQVIINNAAPKSLKVGRKFTLRAEASSGLRVSISSSTAAVCRVQGSTITALRPGTCRLSLNVPGTSFGQARFIDQQKSISFKVVR